MIDFEKFTLANGLAVYVHQDNTVPTAVVNLLYNVGSRDEQPDKTGFAHLFEHLMFGGSKNIQSFDEHLQKVGGENNAFTSNDITNYYITLPAVNIETAFWLESDRMLSLSFDEKVLEVQRSVVIEEFKQRYLNQPYGDVWLHLRPLAYQVHPYQWPTIGKEPSHIENATKEDVRSFFAQYYTPNNAILVVAGAVTLSQVKGLAEKWFGPIPTGAVYLRNLPKEPQQTQPRKKELTASVPLDALYKVYHMPGKTHPDYYGADVIGDMLGRGKSSRLYQKLVKEKQIFNSVNAHITGSMEPGLLIIEGKLSKGNSIEIGDEAVQEILASLTSDQPIDSEMIKVKNQAESTHVFGEMEVLNRAMNIAFAAALGDADYANQEVAKIQKVTPDDIRRLSSELLTESNSSTLYYRAGK